MIAEMVQAFCDAAAQARRKLGQCVADGSMRAAKDAAHQMKSGARSIGALRLGAICEEIEQGARFGVAPALGGLVGRFNGELDRVLAFLDANPRLG